MEAHPDSEITIELTEQRLRDIYSWVDGIPLTRPKKSIARDFSDAGLAAEIVARFFPKLVEVHNYVQTSSVSKKEYNWRLLNQKVLKKLGFTIPDSDIKLVSNSVPGAIERVLIYLREKLEDANGQEDSQIYEEPKKTLAKPTTKSRISESPKGKAPTPGLSSKKPVDTNKAGDKDIIIRDLQETVALLQAKVEKMEQLLRLKDAKIEALSKHDK